jgi:hypothetical protein
MEPDTAEITLFAMCYRRYADDDDIYQGLAETAPGLVETAVTKYGSLRKAADALETSATYLCRVRQGQERISYRTYIRWFRQIYIKTAVKIETSPQMAEWIMPPDFA